MFHCLLASLPGLSGRFPGNGCWHWELGQWNEWREVGGEDLPDLVEMGQRRRGTHQVICYRGEGTAFGGEQGVIGAGGWRKPSSWIFISDLQTFIREFLKCAQNKEELLGESPNVHMSLLNLFFV